MHRERRERKAVKATAFLLAGWLATAAVSRLGAQDAPESAADSEEVPTSPWRYGLEFGLNGAAGNASFLTLLGGVELARGDDSRYSFESRASARYGSSGAETIENWQQIASSLRFRGWSRLAPVVSVTTTRDVRRRIALQLRSVGAVGVQVWKGGGGGSSLDLDVGVAGEYENFTTEASQAAGAGEERSAFRFSLGVQARRPVGPMAAALKGNWRPRPGGGSDQNLDSEVQLSTELLENWSLVLRYSILWDEVPPPGATPYDHKFGILLRVALWRS